MTRAEQLLRDLAKAMVRNRVRDLSELTVLLAKPGADARLAELMASAPKPGPKRPRAAEEGPRHGSLTQSRRREIMNQIRHGNQTLSDDLEKLIRELRERALLPSAEHLREFARSIGLKDVQASRDRREIQRQVVDHLVLLPRDELASAIDAAREFVVGPRDDFPAWVDNILKPPSIKKPVGVPGPPAGGTSRPETGDSAHPPGSSKYIAEVVIIPPNDPRSQPVKYVMDHLGVPVHALRERPDPDNHYSFRFPYEVWAFSRDDARTRLLQMVGEALVDALRNQLLSPHAVSIEVDQDTLRGPSLG